jgi:hypothetical protein
MAKTIWSVSFKLRNMMEDLLCAAVGGLSESVSQWKECDNCHEDEGSKVEDHFLTPKKNLFVLLDSGP